MIRKRKQGKNQMLTQVVPLYCLSGAEHGEHRPAPEFDRKESEAEKETLS